MENIVTDFSNIVSGMQNNFLFSLKLLGIFWAVHILNLILGYRLNVLGITPRRLYGLPGIFFSPFLHANFTHLFFNSIPFLVLTDLILTEGKLIYYSISIEIIILSGILVWIFGKRAIHIGASALIMGFFGFLLGKAYFQLNATTIILAGLCLYYFGGLFIALFPSVQKNVSWESHIFGFLAGIFTAFYNKTILWFVGIG